MFGWLRRMMGGRREPSPRSEDVEPLRFSEPTLLRLVPARSAVLPAPGARIIDRYVYGTTRGGEDHAVCGVEYLDVMEQPSNGFT